MRREAERLAARRSEAGRARTAGRSRTLAATPSSLRFTRMRTPHALTPDGVAPRRIVVSRGCFVPTLVGRGRE